MLFLPAGDRLLATFVLCVSSGVTQRVVLLLGILLIRSFA